MTALDRVLPAPRMVEVDTVHVAVPPERAWKAFRHMDLAAPPVARALFKLRTLPERLGGGDKREFSLCLDELRSSPERPGFQILVDEAPEEVVVGAIGKVWRLEIPFVHIENARAFADFSEAGFVKVAWAIRLAPEGTDGTRVTFELRIDATDGESWKKFRRYFRLIGPGSRFIHRSVLATIERELGSAEPQREARSLPGDDLLPDAKYQGTYEKTMRAKPETIWPWLVQMGCQRGGFYSVDLLDNGGARSAREIHPELQDVRVGDMLPATPEEDASFEVLVVEPNRALVLGGLYDLTGNEQVRFKDARPGRFWHVTWAFVLQPLDDDRTRLSVRSRVAYPKSALLHAGWILPVHHLMQRAQLRHLAARVEGRLARDDWRDVAQGFGGAAVMMSAFATPFLRRRRNHWGVDETTAARAYPGDEILPRARWSWTHGIEIDATADDVWPWIAQIGADRGGFYSYQWLENLAGCNIRNTEVIHPEWTIELGGAFTLHPKVPPLRVVSLVPGRYFVAHAAANGVARAAGEPWIEATWLCYLEPIERGRCRFISRYRCATSDDVSTRLRFGPMLVEPIGYAMDRRMLLSVKRRAEVGKTRGFKGHPASPPTRRRPDRAPASKWGPAA